jgi:hypothetical protein
MGRYASFVILAIVALVVETISVKPATLIILWPPTAQRAIIATLETVPPVMPIKFAIFVRLAILCHQMDQLASFAKLKIVAAVVPITFAIFVRLVLLFRQMGLLVSFATSITVATVKVTISAKPV